MNFKPLFSTKSPRTKVTTYCGLTHVNFTNMSSGISYGGKIFSAVGTLDTSVSCFSQQGFPVRFRFEGAWGRGHQISWVKTSYCKNQWIRGLYLISSIKCLDNQNKTYSKTYFIGIFKINETILFSLSRSSVFLDFTKNIFKLKLLQNSTIRIQDIKGIVQW